MPTKAQVRTPAPHRSHLLRKGRFSETGRAYVVTTVTRDRVPLFRDWEAGHALVREVVAAPVQTLAWVVMPDHLHWMLVLGDGDLGEVVGAAKSLSAGAINRVLGRKGTVWQKGYYDRAVRQDEDLRKLARYIVANPIRAGLVDRIGDYPFWDAVWL